MPLPPETAVAFSRKLNRAERERSDRAAGCGAGEGASPNFNRFKSRCILARPQRKMITASRVLLGMRK